MDTNSLGGQPMDPKLEQTLITLDEYKALIEDTSRSTDRRQSVNTLFVTINALFLTAVGILLLQFAQNNGGALADILFIFGFIAIAIITHVLNRAWLKLSDQNRRLISLRIRYLQQLEDSLRVAGYFVPVETPLRDNETPPPELNDTLITRQEGEDENKKPIIARYMKTRGTYTLETALYNNPTTNRKPFGFSKAEQRIGRTFIVAYYLAAAAAIVGFAAQVAILATGAHFQIGPVRFF